MFEEVSKIFRPKPRGTKYYRELERQFRYIRNKDSRRLNIGKIRDSLNQLSEMPGSGVRTLEDLVAEAQKIKENPEK